MSLFCSCIPKISVLLLVFMLICTAVSDFADAPACFLVFMCQSNCCMPVRAADRQLIGMCSQHSELDCVYLGQVQLIAAELDRALAEAHGDKQRLEEAHAEQNATIASLQESCKAAEDQVGAHTLLNHNTDALEFMFQAGDHPSQTTATKTAVKLD